MPDSINTTGNRLIPAGEISGVYGVKGWVRVRSWLRPPENLLKYDVWTVKRPGSNQRMKLEEGRSGPRGLTVSLASEQGQLLENRDQAARLIGAEIMISRSDMPDLTPGEFYWADLIGLSVVNTAGHDLGRVKKLIETGANDVLVVQGDRERLIPYVNDQVIMQIDLQAGVMTVDWDADY